MLSPPEAELPCCVLAGDGEESSTCKKQKGRETRRRSRSAVCHRTASCASCRYHMPMMRAVDGAWAVMGRLDCQIEAWPRDRTAAAWTF